MTDRIERDMVRTAIAQATVHGSISRRLGDELIDAGREVIAAWHARRNSENRMAQAIAKLEQLVGRP
jgi:ribosomal protein S7